jgi:predicted nuclease with TOPRIM domain
MGGAMNYADKLRIERAALLGLLPEDQQHLMDVYMDRINELGTEIDRLERESDELYDELEQYKKDVSEVIQGLVRAGEEALTAVSGEVRQALGDALLIAEDFL